MTANLFPTFITCSYPSRKQKLISQDLARSYHVSIYRILRTKVAFNSLNCLNLLIARFSVLITYVVKAHRRQIKNELYSNGQ